MNQYQLLRWLAQRDYSQYGECHGRSLSKLLDDGLAQVHGPDEHQEGFISKGPAMMTRAVSLTDKGRETLRKLDGPHGES